MEKQVVNHTDMPEPYGDYYTAVRAGDFLFISGQAGILPAKGAKAGDDFESQKLRGNCANVLNAIKSPAWQESGLPYAE